MTVQELVTISLQALPDQNATVVIGEGVEKETWLLVSGVVGLHRSMCNTPTLTPQNEPAQREGNARTSKALPHGSVIKAVL